MPTEKKPNLFERFLFGPNANKGIVDVRDAKGLFPYDATYAANNTPWSIPTPNGYGTFYGGSVDYAVEAGDLIDNSAVMACILWILRTFPEARIRVMKRVKGGKPEEVEGHPLTALLARPNPYYSGRLLQQPSLVSYNWRGETYWRKVRNSSKQVIQLYYEPHWTCRPVRSNADEFISYYQLYRNSEWVDVDKEDIIHIRQGLDPENPMHGLSSLASSLREVFTDNAAARYASAMMRNLGVPGMIVTPKTTDDTLFQPNDPDSTTRLKAELKSLTTGDNRGDPLLFNSPLDIVFPQIDPSKMDTRTNRKISEERISALLGVPAIVAGLGAGLDRSTFSNMSEAREMAYESNIIPTQSLWADELNTQLLSELGDPSTEFVDWDYSTVRVLQDDENKKATKWAVLFKGGIALRSEARADLSLPVRPEDEVFASGATSSPQASTLPGQQDNLDNLAGGKAIDHETGIVKAHTNGHTPVLDDLLTKALPKKAESIVKKMQAELQDEVERVYNEAADKVEAL